MAVVAGYRTEAGEADPGSADSLAGDAGARGARVLAPFKRDLQQALRAGLAQGPLEAIGACRVRAPEIAESLSRGGVRVGRASHRLRNPANAGPDWVRPLLDGYRDAFRDVPREDPLKSPGDVPANLAPKSVTLADDRTGYVEPILVQPLCLTCHGEALAPDVAERIRAVYPQDRALGYRAGDLRGVFWAELPAAD